MTCSSTEKPPIPIIVLAAPHSGGELLVDLLHRHPRIGSVEGVTLSTWSRDVTLRVLGHPTERSTHPDSSTEDSSARLQQALRSFYSSLFSGGLFWCEFLPADSTSNCLESVEATFPEARYVHVVRDGRDVVASLLEEEPFHGDRQLDDACARWTGALDSTSAFYARIPSARRHEVRYEQLAHDPLAVMHDLFDWVGLSCQEWPTNALSDVDALARVTTHALVGDDELAALEALGAHLVRHGYETRAAVMFRKRSELKAELEAPRVGSTSRADLSDEAAPAPEPDPHELNIAEELEELEERAARLRATAASAVSQASASAVGVEEDGDAPTQPSMDYSVLLHDVRRVVEEMTPPQSCVAVVSNGDEALLGFSARRGVHYPQTADGTYLGYHPACTDDAIAHLELAKANGTNFLVFPSTAFWWLEHYPSFRGYLDARFRCVHMDETAVVYELWLPNGGQNGRVPEDRYRLIVQAVRRQVEEITAPGSCVAVVSKGDEALVEFAGRRGLHYPQTEDGNYLGYHPATTADVTAHIEFVKSKGAHFLVFPCTAYWWLDHYPSLRESLDSCYQRVETNDEVLIYELRQPRERLFGDLVHRLRTRSQGRKLRHQNGGAPS